ncbi:dihydrolipoyl dehydrogenase [Vagococcus carniphilus]|uniref:Dihydrolipoyl dehydrogenase n=1 Tax=Vagococcus carniphilus TaxID=218144 RepID=A0A430B891_9ENTE|nr:dihydrolipoyl dehydrogenase [Vagococcus carniphilus]MDT2814195.1 dihydrolipoyl dehydrogenase [Vagococcus carniphilus]MDT2829313.1 dihydrolipoyl dehydrogenase [Vagococcus carniphilus]MDT2833480.1 dihydrolipoyl dehydrogenase [Vagococcus carniphilus]MDT2838772.1 dihydrolipoyl dehydrogenase [Vagococcus carniphilus]MDT2849067.1 dihydrolipoyl dehydrogenase [Vagococcus carniphilus]
MAEQTDLLILGGGTGGYVAAIRAAQSGLNVTIVEKYKLGGTCLHRGCIPTKALLRSAEVYDTIKEAETFGIEGKNDHVVNFKKIQERKQSIIDQLHSGVEGLCKKNKIRVLEGEGAILGPSIFSPVSGAVAVTFNDKSKEEEIIVPKNVIIATGSTPRTLPNLPLDEKNILSSDGMLQLEELPKSIVIVGGGVIGVEWASLLNSLGVEVTIVEFLDRLLINESSKISRELKKSLTKKGINVLLSSKVESAEIKGDSVEVSIEGKDKLTVDKVMVAIGRAPKVEGIGLQNTSVKYEPKGIQVNEFYQTTESHIYAIGDCIDTMQLAHVAMKEGELAVAHILEEEVQPLNYNNVPRGVYTNPEVASVGYVKENVPADKKVKIGTFNFAGNGKSLVYGANEGFVEVIRDLETDDLLGVSIIGPHATDLISEASTAIYMDASPIEIGEAIHPHPTLTEVIQEAALDTYGKAIHK